jgi:isopenicillin N synthase-like dioxygenase
MGSIAADRCADLKAISLVKLLAGDSESAKDLVQACKENGFFYLDFRGPSTSRSLKQVDELINVGNAVFSLPLEEKEAYSTEKYLPSRLLGYASNKMTGSSTIALTSNTVTSAPDVQSDHLRRRRMAMRAFQ